ncbi:uncharacterized protein MELLADRAFT_105771 [Melampsora larici-populina 98AG31]|uniref:Uncharacterized protein n=1 Tax=Melampsora larici-populina (strain 98AG31 / pathotype 3-4-7) TaxID=747676 RepID=F4RJ98_MELLP|nr:uncharacterized protein MELLADRAFT_105771 [Melampsora larici-populina 98AG31]EGG07538.1 hypothetical protein MELLADRAFT_105771 [Melampsora larici-populina 98AG31]
MFEAQSLQAQYNLDKTMLCIVHHITRNTLDEALLVNHPSIKYIPDGLIHPFFFRHEGPMAREPNKYTNYLSYSLTSTQAKMPPKGVATGFKARNKLVGNTWTAYSQDERDVFHPKIFERLCQQIMETPEPSTQTLEAANINTLDAEEATPIDTQEDKPLSNEQINKYMPHFQRLVNVQTVSWDFKHGVLCRHSGKIQHLQQVAKAELKKVLKQLFKIHDKFGFHFHLLMSAWKPESKATHALYQDEESSCAAWLDFARTELHLLERFAVESTQAPPPRPNTKKGRKQPVSLIVQAAKRKELISLLNGLVGMDLPGFLSRWCPLLLILPYHPL